MVYIWPLRSSSRIHKPDLDTEQKVEQEILIHDHGGLCTELQIQSHFNPILAPEGHRPLRVVATGPDHQPAHRQRSRGVCYIVYEGECASIRQLLAENNIAALKQTAFQPDLTVDGQYVY